jgi:hypothetical protein
MNVLGSGFTEKISNWIESPFIHINDPHFMLTFEFMMLNYDPINTINS